METNKERRPKVGLGVLIMKDGKVLCGKRTGAHASGTWCFPGGHLEFGESWEECARRETEEESGLKVENPRFIAVTNDIYTGEDAGKHYVTIFMRADYAGGEPERREPDKFETWEWFVWDKLPSPILLSFSNLIKSGYRP